MGELEMGSLLGLCDFNDSNVTGTRSPAAVSAPLTRGRNCHRWAAVQVKEKGPLSPPTCGAEQWRGRREGARKGNIQDVKGSCTWKMCQMMGSWSPGEIPRCDPY
ncbi:hypothetical protein FKM82_002902 [Ascaphus truei]